MYSPSKNLLTCNDCGTDLTFKFCHYFLLGNMLCGYCRSQYDENGFSETRGQLRKVI
ncbi:MAG: hypothetical protein V3U87_15805 [Methylococcaceae bacterium]